MWVFLSLFSSHQDVEGEPRQRKPTTNSARVACEKSSFLVGVYVFVGREINYSVGEFLRNRAVMLSVSSVSFFFACAV